MTASKKKFLFLGSTGYATEQASTDGLDINSLTINGLSTGVLHADASGNVSSSNIVNADIDAAAAIADSKLATISTAGKVSNSATTATKDSTANAIVARDGSGNFAAGTITAALSGNASTAGKWASARTVPFAGGDVTGTFDIDGSANVANVALTIGSSKVLNDMLAGSIAADKLAGSIPDSLLQNITSAGKVADSALSAKVLLTDAARTVSADYTFSGAINVPTPTAAAHAVTKAYADSLANGLDPKQEVVTAIAFSAFATDITSANLSAWVTAGYMAVGDRLFITKVAQAGLQADVHNGIYVLAQSGGTYSVERSADMATGSDAAGASVFCPKVVMQQNGSWQQDSDFKSILLCSNAKPATVGTAALVFVVFYSGVAAVTATAPLLASGNNVSLSYGNGLTAENDSLALDISTSGGLQLENSAHLGIKTDSDVTTGINGSNQLVVKGVPTQFKLGGTNVDSSVTAANLGKLMKGVLDDGTDATALHSHQFAGYMWERAAGQSAFAKGCVVVSQSSDAKLIRADKRSAQTQSGQVVGLVYDDNSGKTVILNSGFVEIASAIWPSGVGPGSAVYLGNSGALVEYSDLGAGDYVIKIGRCLSGRTIAVELQDVGLKAA